MLGRGGQLSIVSIIEKNDKNTAGVPGTPTLGLFPPSSALPSRCGCRVSVMS